MSHDHHPGDAVQFTQEFWDDRYRSADRLWSGQPNPSSWRRPPAQADSMNSACAWVSASSWTPAAVGGGR